MHITTWLVPHENLISNATVLCFVFNYTGLTRASSSDVIHVGRDTRGLALYMYMYMYTHTYMYMYTSIHPSIHPFIHPSRTSLSTNQ